MRATATLAARALTFAGLSASIAACAPARTQQARPASAEACEYVVRNATGMALDVRRFAERRLVGIGALNPSEQLTESTPCAEGRVYVLGIPIPLQVGVPSGKPVFGFVDLEPGKRAQLSLYWP